MMGNMRSCYYSDTTVIVVFVPDFVFICDFSTAFVLTQFIYIHTYTHTEKKKERKKKTVYTYIELFVMYIV